MFKPTLSVIAILILSFVIGFSQGDFRDGFIVNLDNDTIYGQLDYRFNSKNYTSCKFKQGNIVTEYSPNQIKEFRYIGDKLFSSEIENGAFVEVLITGDLSIYKFKSEFILRKKRGIDPRLDSLKSDQFHDYTISKSDKRWRGIAISLTDDCLDKPGAKILKTAYHEKHLTALVNEYNLCRGTNSTVFKAHKPWLKFNVGIIAGIEQFSYKTFDHLVQFTYIGELYRNSYPTGGLYFKISTPKITEKIELSSEIRFSKTSYYGYSAIERSFSLEISDTFIDLTTISVPLAFNYNVNRASFNFYGQIGVNFDIHLTAETRWQKEVIINNVIDRFNETAAFPVDKSQIGILAGIGINKSFRSFNLGLLARIINKSELDNSTGFKSSNNAISLSLILFK